MAGAISDSDGICEQNVGVLAALDSRYQCVATLTARPRCRRHAVRNRRYTTF